jgi:glycine/D-amino acid oxidase-like deaminating enzyme/nitrite reductase/ring-hydroxylating ferredoxin subunit
MTARAQTFFDRRSIGLAVFWPILDARLAMNRHIAPQKPSTNTIWAETQSMTELPPLAVSTTCDVCIIGGGIAGLSVAHQLARARQRVIVLDDGPLGGGQTAVTTAHLASEIDDRISEVERIRGEHAARLAVQSHAAAINRIEANVRELDITCDFHRVDGYLFTPPGESRRILDAELAAANRTGVLDVEEVARAPWPDFDTGRALKFAQQAQFHPLKYLSGLAQAIVDLRGELHSGTHVSRVEGGPEAIVETTEGKSVRAKHVVVATNTPINDMIAIHTKQAPYMSYVIAGRVPRGSVPLALYWDTQDPYHYVRIQPAEMQDGGDLLIIGGEDHKTGQAADGDERFARLEAWARERFPQLGPIEYHWAGQVMETLDGLAYLGRNPLDEENVYIATGDSGMGMTHGVIAGMLISDLILGRANPWRDLYDPARKPLAVRDFASENLNVAAQYTSWLTPGEVSDVAEILPGHGAILRSGLQKIAAYRDESGKLHKLSAVCPHMKCIVAWNPTEKTWDCPCHGSRFAAEGKVIVGPSNVDLPPVE